MKKVSLRNDELIIKFNGPDWKDSLALCKSKQLSGTYCKYELKEWRAKNDIDNIKVLEKAGFDLSKELFDMVYEEAKPLWTDIKLGAHLDYLKPYQAESYQFLEYHKGRGLIGLPAGAGKTVVTWQYLMDKDLFPALIICPVNVKLNWQNEYHKWFKEPISIKILEGYEDEDTVVLADYVGRYDVIIANPKLFDKSITAKKLKYPTGKMVPEKEKGKKVKIKVDGKMVDKMIPETRNRTIWKKEPSLEEFIKNKFKTVVIDEIHFLKKDTAAKYQAIHEIAKKVKSVIGLSGTPMDGSPVTLFTTLNFIRPDLFPSKWDYQMRYCDPYYLKSKNITTFKGATNTAELHSIISSEVMFRVSEEEVHKNLPEKTEKIVSIPLNNPEGYDRYAKFISKSLAGVEAEEMQLLGKLLRIVYIFKREVCFKLVDDLLTKNRKIMVFANNKNVINDYMERYKGNIVKITGATPGMRRQAVIEKFNNDPTLRILMANYISAGVALDGLQAATNTCVFLQIPFSPGKIKQAIARVYRHGQLLDVDVYFFIGKGTIEEDILENIDINQGHVDAIIDGIDSEEKNMMRYLLMKYKGLK